MQKDLTIFVVLVVMLVVLYIVAILFKWLSSLFRVGKRVFRIRRNRSMGNSWDYITERVKSSDGEAGDCNTLNSEVQQMNISGDLAQISDEVVSAITSAIYVASNNRPGYKLVVKSIKRCSQIIPMWNRMI